MQDRLIKEIADIANQLMADWPPTRNMQKQFVLNYVANGFTNASEAARNAGYSEKTATKQASLLLSKLDKTRHVADVVNELKKAFDERNEELKIADGTEVLQHLTRVMRREEFEHQVVTVREKEEKWVTVEGGQLKKQTIEKEMPQIVSFPTKVSDTNRAAELLGRGYSLWSDSQTDNKAVEINIVPLKRSDTDGES